MLTHCIPANNYTMSRCKHEDQDVEVRDVQEVKGIGKQEEQCAVSQPDHKDATAHTIPPIVRNYYDLDNKVSHSMIY